MTKFRALDFLIITIVISNRDGSLAVLVYLFRFFFLFPRTRFNVRSYLSDVFIIVKSTSGRVDSWGKTAYSFHLIPDARELFNGSASTVATRGNVVH